MFKGIIFFLIACQIVFMGFLQHDILFNIPSVLIVIGGVIVLLYIAFSLSDIGEAAGFVFGRDREIARGKYLKLSHLYSAAGDYALYCGLTGTFIGFVRMLETIIDPSTIAPKFAVAFVTLLYGIAVKLLAVLAQRKLELCTVTEESYELKPRKQLRSFVIGGILFILIVVLFITQGGSFLTFLNIVSGLIILGGSLFVALLFVPGAYIIDSFKAAFSSGEVTGGQAKKALGVFTRFNDVVVSLAIITAVAASLAMLGTMSVRSTIGPLMALILLSIFYGVFLICFIRGLFCIVQRRLAGLGEQIDERPVFTANIVILLGLTAFIMVVVILAPLV